MSITNSKDLLTILENRKRMKKNSGVSDVTTEKELGMYDDDAQLVLQEIEQFAQKGDFD